MNCFDRLIFKNEIFANNSTVQQSSAQTEIMSDFQSILRGVVFNDLKT